MFKIVEKRKSRCLSLLVGCILALGTVAHAVVVEDYGSTPSTEWGKAKMYALLGGGSITSMYVKDSAGNATCISPHRFSLYQPAPLDPMPWTYNSTNAFIGKRINVDMSGAIMALEQLTGQQFIYLENLPAEEIVDADTWRTSETLKLEKEAKRQVIEQSPLIEIPFADAWEEVDEVLEQTTIRTITKYRVNWETLQAEPYETEEEATVSSPTGRKTRQMRKGVSFDENTGKCYRSRTMDDVIIDPSMLPEVRLPQYVQDRLYR